MKIDNISASGIGPFLPPEADVTSLTEMSGVLNFAGQSQALKLRVVRFNGESIGAIIENATSEFQRALTTYFESELAALELRSTSADYLKPVAIGTPHWFQGPNNCDLSYISNGNEVLEFALTAFGNHLEGGAGKPLRLSEVLPDPHFYGHKGSDLLNAQRVVDPEVLTLAKRFVEAIGGLPEDHRASLLRFLN